MQFYAQANLPAARAACESLLVKEPDSPRAHWLLTTIELGQGHYRKAVGHARRAVERVLALPAVQGAAAARNLIAVGEYRAAHQVLEALDTSSPANAPALVAIVEQMLMLGDPARALAASNEALGRGAVDPVHAYLRSNALRYTGDLDGAAQVLETLAETHPGYAYAHWGLASLGKRDEAALRADRVRSLLAASAAAPATPGQASPAVLLGYALFKELDAAGDTAGAWQALDAAMAAQRAQTPYDRKADDELFRTLEQTYTSDYVRPVADAPLDGPAPIFIVGLPRTGTTLVERMLGRHPLVAPCGELNELHVAYRWATDLYAGELLEAQAAKRMPQIDAAALGRAYLHAVAWRVGGKPFFTDKHQSNFLFTGLILRALPRARIVHVEREAMDACFSNLKELFSPFAYPYSYGLGDVAHHYRNYRQLMRHLDEVAPGRILRVRYEDLVSDPQPQLLRISEFCGLPPAEGLDDIAANPAPVSTASSAQVREPLHQRNVGGWRRYERELQPLADLLRDAD